MPSKLLLDSVRDDYEAMKEMFFGAIIPFSDIEKNLLSLEKTLSAL